MGERRRNRPEPSAQLPSEPLTLDLGIEPATGSCAHCGASVRQGGDVAIRRRDQFGVCVVTLRQTCRDVIGEEGIVAMVAARERHWASLLGDGKLTLLERAKKELTARMQRLRPDAGLIVLIAQRTDAVAAESGGTS